MVISSTPSKTTSNDARPSVDQAPKTDIIGRILGDFGEWQLRTVLIIYMYKIPGAWFMACLIFTAPELYPKLEFTCIPPPDINNPVIDDDQCHFYTENGTKIACTKYVYHDTSFYSFIMQFDLVCHRRILIIVSQFWHLFGTFVGMISGYLLVTRITPKQLIVLGLVLQTTSGYLCGYARDYSWHCFGRMAASLSSSLIFIGGQTIFNDITAGVYRLRVCLLFDFFWSVGLFVMPTVCLFCVNYTQVFVAISTVPGIMLITVFFLPNPPRWLLLHRNDVETAEKIVRAGAIENQRADKIPADLKEELSLLATSLKENQPEPVKYHELWSGPRAPTFMVASHLALTAFYINFLGMMLNVRSVSRESLSQNTMIMGLAQSLGSIVSMHTAVEHSSRKWQIAGWINIFVGALGWIDWVFYLGNYHCHARMLAWITVASLAKGGTSVAQSMLYACVAESLTPAEKITFRYTSVIFSRFFLMSGPFIGYTKNIAYPVSLSVFCLLSVMGGIALLFMHDVSKSKIINTV